MYKISLDAIKQTLIIHKNRFGKNKNLFIHYVIGEVTGHLFMTVHIMKMELD